VLNAPGSPRRPMKSSSLATMNARASRQTG
jgi:hypothetical protein